ncbi:MAG: phosphoesterase [Gammaproteobacteria bacterium]|nr:phosphoesterase [Gammaproteobacteria bacterium]
MSKPLVIYHANCLDGFAAALAAHLHFSAQGVEADYFAAKHGNEPPVCVGREVYIVDFSYKRAVLKQICAVAASVTILDHHISAQEDLDGLTSEHDNLAVTFDMERSGAVLSWEYFHDTPPPALLLHVQDRDLWRFELDGSDAINTALMSYPFSFAFWKELVDTPARLAELRKEGETINRFRRQLIEQYKSRAVLSSVAGHRVPVVNAPHAIISELLGELAQDYPFAVGYQDHGNKRSWSLRSRRDGGEDVAKIAELFGGGGHCNAAGFGTELPPGLLTLESS